MYSEQQVGKPSSSTFVTPLTFPANERITQLRNPLEHRNYIDDFPDEDIIEEEQSHFHESEFAFSEISQDNDQVITMSKQQLKQLKKKRIGESSSYCIVCHDKYQRNEVIRVLPCQHFFHYKCLKPWFRKSNACPLCRMDIKSALENQESPIVDPNEERIQAMQQLWNK